MSEVKIILLCSSRFALPVLRELAFFNMLAAVAIPGYCEEWMENAAVVLSGTNIPIIELDKENFVDKIRETIDERKADLGLVMSFPYKIPACLYTIPAKGFYN